METLSWKHIMVAGVAALACLTTGCTTLHRNPQPGDLARERVATVPPEYTPVPTVPPRTPTPVNAKPLPTRPVKNPETERIRHSGKPVGPIVTYAGIARADGFEVKPISVDKHGIPTFRNYVGSGFQIVIEGKPGISNIEIGRRIFVHDPNDPSARPDLEIEATQNLGDGSTAVCDSRRPHIGGIPKINPPSFAKTQKIADALNDFSCRFETFIESDSACIVTRSGEFSFINPESTIQFCMVVARAWNFPVGETLVSVRLRDAEGNPGPVKKFRVLRPKRRPTPPKRIRKPTPTPRRRRP